MNNSLNKKIVRRSKRSKSPPLSFLFLHYFPRAGLFLSKEPGPKLQSNLPKATTQNAKTEWSLTGGGRLQESNHGGPLPRRGPGTSTLCKISYDMCSSILSLKFFVYSK